MSTEYGLFSDEGCIENGFYSEQEARDAIAERYSPEDELEVREVCRDHEYQPRVGCEICDLEEDDSDEEDEEDEE